MSVFRFRSPGAIALVLGVGLVAAVSWSTACADANAPESGASVVKGSGEKILGAPTRPKVDWSPADRALRRAMAGDPSFTTDVMRLEAKAADPSFPIAAPSDIAQASAIAGWKQFLQRDDLTKEQQVFAWWRLGSLYAYNFDPSRGERADVGQAERAMEQVRNITPGLVSFETLNSATVYGSLGGASGDRARRLAEAHNWLATLGEKEVDSSIASINRAGYVVRDEHILGGGKRNQTPEELKEFLQKLLAQYRETLAKRITEEIQYSDDPAAIGQLLKAIEGPAADPEMMDRWRGMYDKLAAANPGSLRLDAEPVRVLLLAVSVAAIGALVLHSAIRLRRRSAPQRGGKR